ncbi:MAG: SIS domain-containing protein, partial [Proteiniphilum sp.]
DSSFLTAYCNDYCFEDVFSRQVLALGRKGDVLMGISTSGSSENIIRAIREADNIGMGTISLSRKGGRSGQYADVAIEVDSTKTAVIQNVHMAVEHVLCYIVEELIFGENSTADKG